MVNCVFIEGRLVRNPEVGTTKTSAMPMCRFRIAHNYRVKDSWETSFIDVIFFGKEAEYCAKSVEKGTRVIVQGRWQSREYEGENGKKTVHEIIGNNISIVDINSPEQREEAKRELKREAKALGRSIANEIAEQAGLGGSKLLDGAEEIEEDLPF